MAELVGTELVNENGSDETEQNSILGNDKMPADAVSQTVAVLNEIGIPVTVDQLK